MFSANIICDSTNGIDRLTTFELVQPKSLLAQLNTHRVFSRNAASSRAIPTKKLLSIISSKPFIPVWTLNQKGMKGIIEVPEETKHLLDAEWLNARDSAVKHAENLSALGASKENVNRILEPYMFVKVVCSSTEYDNFFRLRDAEDAQEEIAIIARLMKLELANNSPVNLGVNEWHLPYVLEDERNLPLSTLLKISVARCARVSYKTHEEDTLSTVEKDEALYIKLLSSLHLSCFKHQGTPLLQNNEPLTGNFNGFQQYRKMIGY